METAQYTIRTAIIALLTFQAAVLIIRGRKIPAVPPTLGFILCLICYLLCMMTGGGRPIPVWKLPIMIGCFGVPFFFWLMSRSLFDDHFRPRAAHWAVFVVVLAFSYSKALQWPGFLYEFAANNQLAGVILRPFPQVFSLIFVLHALGLAYAGLKADLLERRRRLRIFFIITVGIYAVIVLVFEVMLKGRTVPEGLELVHAVAFLMLTFVSTLRINTLEPEVLFSKPRPAEKTVAAETPDPVLDEKLRKLLEGDKVFRTEGLTVQSLASGLSVPEYKLRRHINHALGYRNFNDFLNHYRVEEARRLLHDPAYGDLAILRLAMDLGYGSLAPFNRAFRRLTGMTPTEYRAQSPAASPPSSSSASSG